MVRYRGIKILDKYLKTLYNVVMRKTNKVNDLSNAYDLFKQFCTERLAEAKPSDRDGMKEIYSKTELFDISLFDLSNVFTDIMSSTNFSNDKFTQCTIQDKTLTLPFESCFINYIKPSDSSPLFNVMSVFLREYSVNTLTGTLYFNLNNLKTTNTNSATINQPFYITIDESDMVLNLKPLKNKSSTYDMSKLNEIFITTILSVIGVLLTLNEHDIVEDHTNKSDYYTFKDKQKKTVKVPNRVIYYTMNKKTYSSNKHKIKPIGRLEYSHAFRVRCHWRRIEPTSIGKDRYGRRVVIGKTFVKDFVKGKGELIRKLRVFS